MPERRWPPQTCADRASCFCGFDRAPPPAMLEATVIALEGERDARIEVLAVYGNSKLAVGSTIGGVVTTGILKVGDRAIVIEDFDSEGYGTRAALGPVTAEGDLLLCGFGTESWPVNVTALAKATLQWNDYAACSRVLAENDARWQCPVAPPREQSSFGCAFAMASDSLGATFLFACVVALLRKHRRTRRRAS
jgi:hypothetical protein